MTKATSAIPGHDPNTNMPDYAAEETARLEREFDQIQKQVDSILARADAFPEKVADVETSAACTALLNDLKSVDDDVEALRVSEGLPYLRRKTAVDNFFNTLRDKIKRRDKKGNDGAWDRLYRRLDDYNQERLAAERREREAAERAERQRVAEARRAAEEAQRKAEEAAAAAERARKPENIQQHQKVAEENQRKADEARDAMVAAQQNASIAAAAVAAKPADTVRERHAGGMNTMATEGYAVIIDEMKLDPVALWAFVPSDAKLKALTAYAKTTNYQKQMPGAEIGRRPVTKVRR